MRTPKFQIYPANNNKMILRSRDDQAIAPALNSIVDPLE